MSDEKLNAEDILLPEVREPEPSDLEDSSVKLLSPKKQRFVHMYLSGQYRLTDIAKLMNMSVATIRKYATDKDVKDVIEQVQMEEDEIVKQGIKALRMKALYKMGELVDSKIDGIAYQAARDILDRTGHKAPTKQEVNVEIYTFEQQIKEVIKQSNNAEEFIDVEYEDV
jgi:hypothetical protein